MKNFLARLLLVTLCLGAGATIAVFTAKASSSSGALVVATCGTLPGTYTPGATRALTVNINGQVCQ